MCCESSKNFSCGNESPPLGHHSSLAPLRQPDQPPVLFATSGSGSTRKRRREPSAIDRRATSALGPIKSETDHRQLPAWWALHVPVPTRHPPPRGRCLYVPRLPAPELSQTPLQHDPTPTATRRKRKPSSGEPVSRSSAAVLSLCSTRVAAAVLIALARAGKGHRDREHTSPAGANQDGGGGGVRDGVGGDAQGVVARVAGGRGRLRPDAAAEPPPPDQRGPAALLRRPLAQRPLALRPRRRRRRLGRRRRGCDGELREHVLPRRRAAVAVRHAGVVRAALVRAPPAGRRGLGRAAPLPRVLPRPAARHHRRRRPLHRGGAQLRPGVRAGLRAERAGLPDERRAGGGAQLPAEDAAAAGVGEAHRPVQAGRGRHAGELQGAQGPEARRGQAGGGLRGERHRPRGARGLGLLVDHPPPRLHQVHGRRVAGGGAHVPEGHPPHPGPVPRRGLRHLPHPALRRRLLHDRPPHGRVRVPRRDPGALLHGAAVRAAATPARRGGEGDDGAGGHAAGGAQLPRALLLLARLPAAQRHLPVQDGGVLAHRRQQVQRQPGVHPGLALRLHAHPRRVLRRQRQPGADGLPMVCTGELRRHPRVARHARPGARHHGPRRGAVGGPRRRDAAQDMLPGHRGPRVADRHGVRPQEHQVELPQRRVMASAALAAHRGVHQDRAAQDREARHRARRGQAGQGRLARVLRRQARPLRREAGEEVPDVVRRRVPGGQDDAGGPLPPRHDLPRGGQGHDQAGAPAVGLVDGLRSVHTGRW